MYSNLKVFCSKKLIMFHSSNYTNSNIFRCSLLANVLYVKFDTTVVKRIQLVTCFKLPINKSKGNLFEHFNALIVTFDINVRMNNFFSSHKYQIRCTYRDT